MLRYEGAHPIPIWGHIGVQGKLQEKQEWRSWRLCGMLHGHSSVRSHIARGHLCPIIIHYSLDVEWYSKPSFISRDMPLYSALSSVNFLSLSRISESLCGQCVWDTPTLQSILCYSEGAPVWTCTYTALEALGCLEQYLTFQAV